MEKLIELLNEYNEIQNYAPIEYYDEGYDGFETNYLEFYKTTLIISKKFGFIKWLVENDKIDFEKPIGEFANKYKLIVPDDFYLKELSKEDELLMLLSIQDNPIEFLVSILK